MIAAGIKFLPLEALNWAILYSSSSSYWVSKCGYSVPGITDCLHTGATITYHLSRQVLDSFSDTKNVLSLVPVEFFAGTFNTVPEILSKKLWLALALAPQPCSAAEAGSRGKSSMAPRELLAKVAAPKSEQSHVPTGVLLLYNCMLKITAWNFIRGHRGMYVLETAVLIQVVTVVREVSELGLQSFVLFKNN